MGFTFFEGSLWQCEILIQEKYFKSHNLEAFSLINVEKYSCSYLKAIAVYIEKVGFKYFEGAKIN